MVDGCVRPRTQIINHPNEHDELFYWDPTSVDIVCKQGHILKNFFKQFHNFVDNGDGATYNITNTYAGQVKSYINEHGGTLNLPDNLKHLQAFTPLELVNWLIYDNYDPQALFSIGKPTSRITSWRENVFNNDLELGLATKYLIQKLSTVAQYWWNKPDNIYGGLKMCVSPAYYLE